MKTIHKLSLNIRDEQEVLLPEDAEILTVQIQNGIPCIWAIVDTKNDLKHRKIVTIGTGHEISNMGRFQKYIGTYQYDANNLVFHVFEVTE